MNAAMHIEPHGSECTCSDCDDQRFADWISTQTSDTIAAWVEQLGTAHDQTGTPLPWRRIADAIRGQAWRRP